MAVKKLALNYDEFIPLDAEELAERGIARAYEQLGPALRKHITVPAEVQEKIDHANNSPSYSVSCLGKDYFIYGEGDHQESWVRATFAFFDIINRQLADTPYRLFAFNGGNELGGMFLTSEQAEKARESLAHKTDWPYLPELQSPWYGQFH